MLQGYGSVILDGAVMTIELAILSVVVAIVLGLLGASGKLFGNRVAVFLADVYTTIVRGVPDLVLMMLIFYGLQLTLNQVTEFLSWEQIDIDPFTAGVLTIGFIYGAYLAETFRGAFLAVPNGQLESGTAYGFTSWQVFRLILFPQMMRHALPGLSNNWLVIMKSTALVSIIGLSDVVKATQMAGKGTYQFFFFTIVAAAVYLFFTTVSNLVFYWLNRRYAFDQRKMTS